MKSPLPSIIAVVAFCAIALVGTSFLLNYNWDNSSQEEFNYTISAEDVWECVEFNQYMPDQSLFRQSAEVTITLDHAPSSPLKVLLYLDDDGWAHVVNLEGVSGTVTIPRNHAEDVWEEGRVWSDPAWFASSDHARLIKTQTVNV